LLYRAACCLNIFFIVVPYMLFQSLLHCCTVHVVSISSSLLYRACCLNLFFIFVPCMLFKSFLYCCTAHVVSIFSLLLYRACCFNLFFIVVPCMLFQSLLYCSNSCTSLHFKILKFHIKTLKSNPYMFRSPLKPSSGGPWRYFARLLNWNVDLHVNQHSNSVT
jgi:hypothetical protein